MEEIHKERSKLMQKQKQEKTEFEKKAKKAKGAMKDAAQAELEALDGKHEAELKQFDVANDCAAAAPAAAAAAPASSSKAPAGKVFKDRHWNGLSKKELEEACAERGLGKKGSKEDLVIKLTVFQQEQATTVAAAPPAAPDATASADAARPASRSSKKTAESDDEEEEEEEDEEEDEEEEASDSDDGLDVDPAEMERQHKREKAVQKAVKHLLENKCPEGFLVDQLVEKLELINVKGFSPEKLGYKTVEKFVKGQPKSVLRLNKATMMVMPP